jgi:hypothetical protein
MAVENSTTKDDVACLARKLADLEGELSDLRRTRDAMQSARNLVERALHHGYAARGDHFDYEAIYTDGFHVLSHLSELACSQVIDVQSAFTTAAKGDAVVGAALNAMHEAGPLGRVWAGEPYPNPE